MHNKSPAHILSTSIFGTNLSRPNIQIDTFVIINALIVLGLCLLLSSKLFLPIGIGVKLADSGYIQRSNISHVITVKNSLKDNKLLILDDSISSINSLKIDLQSRDAREKVKDYNIPILLRVDHSTPLETIVKISNIIREVGYTGIELALNKIN